MMPSTFCGSGRVADSNQYRDLRDAASDYVLCRRPPARGPRMQFEGPTAAGLVSSDTGGDGAVVV